MRLKRLSLSSRVLLGLALGIACGLFFGDTLAFLQGVGQTFIMLLQMAVLPYIILSLIAGIGRLSYQDALRYGKKCGLALLVIWGIALGLVTLFPLTFPDWENASYFSTSLIAPPGQTNLLEMYIPANPFHSLANNIVPAVVLFSVAMGLALIGVPHKQRIIDDMAVLNDAVIRITTFVVQLAPIGVFAIAAYAVGTMSIGEFGRLQVYFFTYLSLWAVLSFWILPVLITSVSPLRYRDVIWFTRDVLITAFATGNFLIVLPVLASKSKALAARCTADTDQADAAVDIIIPTSYNFPSAGKLFSLGFVLFAGWLAETPVRVSDYPALLGSGLFTLFGNSIVAMQFLLDMLRIPNDLVQLFVVSDVFISRFGVMLGTVSTLALALIGTLAVCNALTIRWRRLGMLALGTAALLCLCVGTTRFVFTTLIHPEYQKYDEFVEMDLLLPASPAMVHHQETPPALNAAERARDRLSVIRQRGSIRVGYFRDALPFVFTNRAARLVGFDVDMAHTLARDLGVQLEFVKIPRAHFSRMLDEGICDIVMSGVGMSADRLLDAAFTTPYLDATLAFIVPDYRLEEFQSRDSIRAINGLKVGIGNLPYYIDMIKTYLPLADITIVDTPRNFFRGSNELDALAFVAESGSAWTLVYPAYSVAIPYPDIIKIPVAYALPSTSSNLRRVVNDWVGMKKADQTVARLYAHWILGQQSQTRTPRWCVIRNVLGWVD